MFIGRVYNTAASDKYEKYEKRDDSLSEALRRAIKGFKDQHLTGLTDDDKEEIKRRAKAWLDANPIETPQQRDAFNNYIRTLLRKFGFKGDFDYFISALGHEINGSASERGPADAFRRAQHEALPFMNRLGLN